MTPEQQAVEEALTHFEGIKHPVWQDRHGIDLAAEVRRLREELKRVQNRINEDADRHARELHDVAETAIAEDRWHRKETP